MASRTRSAYDVVADLSTFRRVLVRVAAIRRLANALTTGA
jgi:hypothetical protein